MRLTPFLTLAGAALLLAGCGQPEASGWAGYAEGDYVYVAAPLAGRLDQVAVRAGDTVRQGQPLFALDDRPEQLAVDEARARWQAAQAQVADAAKGRRTDELAVTRAQLEQARAQAELARAAWQRQRELVAKGFASAASQDSARAELDRAVARVAELDASLRVARLPARGDAQDAARAQAEAARQALDQGAWKLGQKQQAAPADAQVDEVFFQPGEYVAAGQPVVALLPPGNVLARFYVPEGERAALAPGRTVLVRCDGCGEPVRARVTRIATEPEFAPPVIYSNAQRARLVFMAEARPEAGSARLHPGQPLDVRPLAEGAR